MLIPPHAKIINLQNKKVYSGQHLNQMIQAVTRWANSLPLPAHSQIGIVGKNSVYYIVSLLGLRNSRHVSVPINYKLSKRQIEHCVQDCAIILCDEEFKNLIPAGMVVQDLQQEFTAQAVEEQLDPDRPSMILYSSGSTGDPKPVCFTYQDIVRSIYVPPGQKKSNIKTLSCNPFFHLAGTNWINQNLFGNKELFVLPQFDTEQVLQTISKYKIDELNLVTPMLLRLLDQNNDNINLKSVVRIFLPSAPVTEKDLKRIKNMFVQVKEIENYYGLTETGSAVFSHCTGLPTPVGSVGRALSFTVTIIDEVLHIKTSELLSNQKHGTQEWFNTGDRFRVDDQGFYYYLGRVDDMFKVNGEKVYPHEIETVLSTHPCVNQSCVMAAPDTIAGSVPVAFVSLTTAIDPEHLINYARQCLAAYQVPRRIVIVDQFPMTGSGKIDRTQLCL
jgi:acyl-CoA synthetase (AMP-forming)/AMP-acid ligase II